MRPDKATIAFLYSVRRLIADTGFTIALFFTVGVATILAFGFGATAEIVASILVLGIASALAEGRLRKRS